MPTLSDLAARIRKVLDAAMELKVGGGKSSARADHHHPRRRRPDTEAIGVIAWLVG